MTFSRGIKFAQNYEDCRKQPWLLTDFHLLRGMTSTVWPLQNMFSMQMEFVEFGLQPLAHYAGVCNGQLTPYMQDYVSCFTAFWETRAWSSSN